MIFYLMFPLQCRQADIVATVAGVNDRDDKLWLVLFLPAIKDKVSPMSLLPAVEDSKTSRICVRIY